MSTSLRGLLGGISYSRNSSLYGTFTARRRSDSGPHNEAPLAVSLYGCSSRQNKSCSVSHPSSAPQADPNVSLRKYTEKNHHHHHHEHDCSDRLTLSGRLELYPIYLPKNVSQHSHTNSSIPSSSHKSTPSVSLSEPRPVLKRASAGQHTKTQHHVSFVNPNLPDALHMHPLLASTHLSHAPISYDVRLAPSSTSIVDRRTRTPIPPHTLSQPATDPPSAKSVLRCDKLPWPVIFHAASTITNLDLLRAVHSALSMQVTQEEWDALGHGTHAQLKATRAYETRCAAAGLGTGAWEGGIRRIDWLGEKTCLVGIEVDRSSVESGVGKLIFARP